MSLTPNKNYNNQATGSNVNTWGVVLNGNNTVIDLNLGGRLNLSVAGSSNVTVTANQAQNLMHILTGALTGNIQYIFPATGGIYMVENDTTGAYTLTIMCAGGTVGGIIPQGEQGIVFINPDNLTAKVDIIGAQYSWGVGAATGSATAQAVATIAPGPYALADGALTSWVAGYSNTGSMTLALGGATATNCVKEVASGYASLSANDIIAGSRYLSVYDAANNAHVVVNPSPVNLFPAGIILPFAGPASTIPAGWILCFGQLVSRSVYPALFAAIGITYGPGDGSTTFALPDLRGCVVAGLDGMGGTLAGRITSLTMSPNGNTLGAFGGQEAVTLNISQMPSHAHTVTDPGHYHGGVFQSSGSNSLESGSNVQTQTSGNTQPANTGISLANTGGGGPHTNLQPTVLMNYIIKAS